MSNGSGNGVGRPGLDEALSAHQGEEIPAGAKPFAGLRYTLEVAASFDEVVASLAAAMGEMTTQSVNEIAGTASSPESFREGIRRFLGPSGFTRFGVIDHGSWLRLFGHHGRLERWIVGNPLIAETMIAKDRTAGLFAPVELLIDERCDKRTHITAVLPSSLIAPPGSPADLRKIATDLDGKLLALLARAGPASPPNQAL